MFMSHQLAEQLQQAQAQSGATGRADLFSAGTLATAPGGMAPNLVCPSRHSPVQAKGEGALLRVQLFCDNVGQVPPEQPIPVTAEWQEFSFDLTTFDCNVEALQAVIFSAGPTAGEFSFQIDEVSFR
jgi:hypothetical protein